MMRQDIQCIRAIAIISVVLFHLFPKYFPNGYLGVDMFFVISGFLMASILTKHELTPRTILEFYYKRTKRILPLYLLVILLITITKQYLQSDVWWDINNIYAFFSSIFLVNQKIIHDKADYFNAFKSDDKSSNLFLHCWSLSVEVQFYCIVPFIFLGVQHFKTQTYKVALLAVIYLSSYSITFISVDPNFTFNFTPARIWQFITGSLIFILKDTTIQKEIDGEFEKSKSGSSEKGEQFVFIKKQMELVGFSTIFFVFLPILVVEDLMRPAITTITAFVIYNEFGNKNEVLSSRILSYIGDISYVVYLIHWPVFIFCRFYFDRVAIIYIILITSIITHHSFETVILRQSIFVVSTVIATLISTAVILQIVLIKNPHFLSRTYSTRSATLINENREFMKDLWKNPICNVVPLSDFHNKMDHTFGHCVFAKGNGTRKVLIVGNSYALNQADVIRQSFNGNYSTFSFLSIIANFAIFENHRDNTDLYVEITKRIVAQTKPDVLFIVTRVSDDQKRPITQDDAVLKQYNENLQFFERVTKKIYIMGAFPFFPINFLNFYIENLQMNYGRQNTFRLSEEEVMEETKFARERFQLIDCEKCELYDLGSVFYENGFYYGYDKKTLLSYFDNDIHLTTHGLQVILPFYYNLTSTIVV